MADVFDVQMYGATGDGSTDDTSSIKAAITAASSGGVVYFGMGNYKISSVLTLPNNVTIVGAGVQGTTIRPATSGQVVFQQISSSSNLSNLSIQNISIASGVSNVSAMVFTLASFIFVDKVEFLGCAHNIVGDRCVGVQITNCISMGNGSLAGGNLDFHSTSTSDYCFNIVVENYYIRNTGSGTNGDAIVFTRCIGSTMSNCGLNDGHIGGNISPYVIRGNSQGCKIVNCYVGACQYGVRLGADLVNPSVLVPPTYITLANLDIDQPQGACIYIEYGAYITVIGGNFTSSGVVLTAAGVLIAQGFSSRPNQYISISSAKITGFSASNGNGVLVGANVNLVTISATQITGCGTGIGVAGGSGTDMSIIGNTLVGNTTAINFGGAATGSYVRTNVGSPDIH